MKEQPSDPDPVPDRGQVLIKCLQEGKGEALPQHVSGGWVQRGALWVIPTAKAGYHQQADAHSDKEHTLLFTLTSLRGGGGGRGAPCL